MEHIQTDEVLTDKGVWSKRAGRIQSDPEVLFGPNIVVGADRMKRDNTS